MNQIIRPIKPSVGIDYQIAFGVGIYPTTDYPSKYMDKYVYLTLSIVILCFSVSLHSFGYKLKN